MHAGRRPRRPAAVREDAGFTLIEVVLAMALFTILVTFTLGMVLKISTTARGNDLRVTAASLVNRQVEAVRGMSVTAIPDGLVTSTTTVGGTQFTIRQTSSLVATNSTVSLCRANSGSLAYRLVTVTVSWPSMGGIPAPRADTLKVIGTNELSSGAGTVAVGITSAAGGPVSDVRVTLAPSGISVTTGDDGCAVFSQVPIGTYTASVDSSGFVGANNVQAQVSSAFGVTAGQVSRTEILYDTATSLPIRRASASTYQLGGEFPLNARSTYVTNSPLPTGCATASACVTALPGNVNYLFPGQYSFWAGSCNDSRTTSSTATATLVPGSNPATMTVPLARVRISVIIGGLALSGRTVTASHAPDAAGTPSPACPSGVSYVLPTSSSTELRVMMPYGTWTFSTPGAAPTTVTVGSTTTLVTLVGA